MTNTAKRYCTVITRTPDQLGSYLYSHTKIIPGSGIELERWGDRYLGLLLETTAREADVDYLINYQAGRLLSGDHYAGRVWKTQRDAADDLLERIEDGWEVVAT